MIVEERFYKSWVVVEPTELEGEWLAHVVDFDIVTQGEGWEGALRNAYDAMASALCADLDVGLDPEKRPPAPPEIRHLLDQVLKNGEPTDRDVIEEKVKGGKRLFLAFLIGMTFEKHRFMPLEHEIAQLCYANMRDSSPGIPQPPAYA